MQEAVGLEAGEGELEAEAVGGELLSVSVELS